MTIYELIAKLEQQAAVYGGETQVAVCLSVPTGDRQNLEETLREISALEVRFTPNDRRRVAIFMEET